VEYRSPGTGRGYAAKALYSSRSVHAPRVGAGVGLTPAPRGLAGESGVWGKAPRSCAFSTWREALILGLGVGFGIGNL
jgi:hypothetical protein